MIREGARRYGALLSLPGAKLPVIASSLGSLPIGMFGLAILLLGREATGSFAVAGRIVGVFALGNAFGAVAQGRLMDRIGQPRVLRPAAVAHVVSLAALVVAAEEDAPAWVLTVCAAAGGLFLPQLPAAMRSLWGTLVRNAQQRETAYAMVTIAFEVTVMTAPALTALVIALASPSAAVLLGAAIATVSALAFSATDGSRRWRGERARRRLGRAARGVRDAHARRGAARVRRGGRDRAGAAARVRRRARVGRDGRAAARAALRREPDRRRRVRGALVAGTSAQAAGDADARAGGRWAVLSAGGHDGGDRRAAGRLRVPARPDRHHSSTLIDTVAPPGTVTEAFTVMVMSIVAGTAVGNALGGALVDGASYEVGALTAAGIAALGAAFAAARRQTLAA